MHSLTARLAALTPERLRGIRRGIEKESLRSHPDGALALTPHPAPLGSPLAHPYITTDFSESQLELVTAALGSVEAVLTELTEIHQAVHHALAALGDEMLWVSSMPCHLPVDETIPIARFGSSNVGRAKSVYRVGLSHRYGRRMQTISGIHYNWSLPGVDSEEYFGLVRNFRRHAFLLLYLFGASPAVCPSFVTGRQHRLQQMEGGTMYLPHATSLRMGRLGYQSDAQAEIKVSYNCLESYADSLEQALTQPYSPYVAFGVRNAGGEYNQLSTALLQIENEFYGTIRAKRTINPGERPLHALRERGVEYVEARLMDLDPFEPVGISADTMRFLGLFMLHCLFTASPPDTPQELDELSTNQHLTASRGREPGLRLQRGGAEVLLTEWAAELLAELVPVAEVVDGIYGGTAYADALARATQLTHHPDELPSARILRIVKDEHAGSYLDFVRQRSLESRRKLLGLPYPPELAGRYAELATESVLEQRRVEAEDSVSFEDYLKVYLAADRLGHELRRPVAATH